jgi:hypothetical protein
MLWMIITLVCGLILTAWVILDALRPKTQDGSFVAPRRKEPNRVWDTIRTERPNRTERPDGPTADRSSLRLPESDKRPQER